MASVANPADIKQSARAAPRLLRLRRPAELLPARPYPGLRPFQKKDWPIFRGRDRLVQDVLRILGQRHFVSVIGPSGSGKSSLVQAGVLAALERRHGRVGVQWRTSTMRPGAAPMWSLADGILRSLRPQQIGADRELPAAEVARLRVLIDTSEDGLGVVMREFGLSHDQNLLLLVDQFEEVFRYRSDEEEEERSRFIELLLAVARDRPPGIYVVTTMRSEYLGYCARFAGLAETLNETHYLVPRMTAQELRQAIVEPAALKSGKVAPDLVERLIADIASQEDQLPILQHTLLWMWIEEERQRLAASGDATINLGLEHYLRLDSGKSRWTPRTAVSRHGDRILDSLTPDERRVAEVMFRRMVEVEESRNRLRRPTRCGTVAKLSEASLAVLQKVIDAFRAEDASFIYVNRQSVAEDTSIDIMHESLIRQWATLDGWVRRERACYEVYNDLCRAAQRMSEGRGSLLKGLELARARHWLWHEQPTRLWARRYGGNFDAALAYLSESEEADAAARSAAEQNERRAREREQQALRTRLEQQTKLARLTHLTAGAALIAVVLAGVATAGFLRANEAVTETKAAGFWHRLKLFGDPLDADAVTALWELTEQDEKVRVSFVRQLADRPKLLQQFGFRPQPIARAVGLRWPAPAQRIGEAIVAHVASDGFEPDDRNMFALVTYTRAVAVLTPRLDETVAQLATQKIAAAINGLAGQDQLSDRELWALAEMVGVFGERLGRGAIEPARARLLSEITAPKPSDASERRARALGRAIDVMVDELTPAERIEAVRALASQLGQNVDAWNATAIPRTLTALLPALDGAGEPELLSALPRAIATSAVARADPDSVYLLALMQAVETLAALPDQAIAAGFGQQLFAQLALPNDPLQQAALVRAAIPLLERPGEHAAALIPLVAANTLLPEMANATIDPAHLARLRQYARDALLHAVVAPTDAARRLAATRALHSLRRDWTAEGRAGARHNPYRRTAQARLLAMLAPYLAKDSAALASADLLATLPRTSNHLTREAIARALTALALPLSTTDRAAALGTAKAMLANTGSSDEAQAWAAALAALLPADPGAATAEIVEALKYPTATGAPTDILLDAARQRWPNRSEIADRTLPDDDVLNWLQKHLPEGPGLAHPPDRPTPLRAPGDDLEAS